jgi:AcrR family transcriptional regulator
MQERASRTRRVILHAAAETFEARGYAATSLRDIVDLEGVSKGALYFHFPSKEALAIAVVKEHYDLWPEVITRLRPRYPRAVRLMLELSREVARLSRESVMVRAGIRLVLERNLIGPAVPRPFVSWITATEMLLGESREQGDLLPGVDLENMARFIVASFAGFQQISEVRNRHGDSSQCVNTMWQCVLPSLVNGDCLSEMASLVHGASGRS